MSYTLFEDIGFKHRKAACGFRLRHSRAIPGLHYNTLLQVGAALLPFSFIYLNIIVAGRITSFVLMDPGSAESGFYEFRVENLHLEVDSVGVYPGDSASPCML